MMIDTHCHVNKQEYNDVELEGIYKYIGSDIMINSSTSLEDLDITLNEANNHNNVYCTIGIHPEYANTYTDEDLRKIEENLSNPKVVGIGEIGLDYHWVNDNKEKQKELFIKQIELANKYNKTIVIHSRDSIEDTYEILKKYAKTKINMHCFSGSVEMARKFINLGAKLGIGGVVTWTNGKKLKEVVIDIPIEYILLETDSPYLTPHPHRGYKNSPLNLKYVAEEIAKLKGLEVEEVIDKTTENAVTQFDLKI